MDPTTNLQIKKMTTVLKASLRLLTTLIYDVSEC